MLLHHNFDVGLTVEEAWAIFTSPERIAPCFPGARLTSVDQDQYRGTIDVTVGPIGVQYSGVATLDERDDESRRAVISASGRDSRGQGTAAATITSQLAPTPSGTAVSVETDLAVTGKVAQFGRGVITDVSEQLLTQFLVNLEDSLDAQNDQEVPSVTAGRPRPSTDSDGPSSQSVAPLNIGTGVLSPMLRRIAPVLMASVVTAAVVYRFARRQSS